MIEFASRRRSWSRGLMVLASAAASTQAAGAQATFNPSGQLWPSGGDPARPSVAVFASAVQCTLVTCDSAPSFGLDVALVGRFRLAVAGPRSAPQYGLSYAWRHLDVATRIGSGTTVSRSLKSAILVQRVLDYVDTLGGGGLRAETSWVAVADSSAYDTTKWSSAEARLTWREARWWVTALVGRVAVAQQGSGVWGGLQLGADLGRGASLLAGVASSPRLLANGQRNAGRSTLSLGVGFNAGVFSRTRSEGKATTPSRTAFVVSQTSAGRIRIAIRVAAADSVEFASDCTQWKAVSMARAGDGWVVEVPALAGLHRANIRVNGGRWIAPPGLASMDDDFAGEVGIFVVQ